MNILAIETSEKNCEVYLSSNNKEFQISNFAPQAHSKRLLGMIVEILNYSKIEIEEIDFISYSAGPGSFTGTRIAYCVSQGLSMPHNITLIPINNANALVRNCSLNTVLYLSDARMNQFYGGVFNKINDDLEIAEPLKILDKDQLFNIESDELSICGNGYQDNKEFLLSKYQKKKIKFETLIPRAKFIHDEAKILLSKGKNLNLKANPIFYSREKIAYNLDEQKKLKKIDARSRKTKTQR